MEDVFKPGTKVLSSDGQEEAVVTGYFHQKCACGKIGKARAKWTDGKVTLLCPRGLIPYKDGFKILG